MIPRPIGVDATGRSGCGLPPGSDLYKLHYGRHVRAMTTVTLEEAQSRLADLASQVEAGETVVVTRGGEPILDLVPHPPERKGGIDWEAGERWLKERGITDPFPYIAPDFDDPLPEDFLLRPLPPEPPSR